MTGAQRADAWRQLAVLAVALDAAGLLAIRSRRWRGSGYRSLPSRGFGIVVAGVLAAVYLLAVVSTLLAVPLSLGLSQSVAAVPGGRLYRWAAILLSITLTGIAARYAYYYYCWFVSRRYFRRPPVIDADELGRRKLPRIKVQITTKGGALPVVQRSVRELMSSSDRHRWLRRIMSIEVITERADEVTALRAEFAGAPVKVTPILLPPDYQTPNGTRLKARALHYLVEQRLRRPVPRGQIYIVHFDEETVVTDQHLLVLLDYLSKDPKPVSQGPILYPLEWELTPWICRTLESMRPFGCSECARVMAHPPPPHLHGSNLVVDEAVENEVGWDFGTLDGEPFIAEDLLFGLRAFSVLGKDGFGWHGATMLEQPPFSLHWAVQQRLRWVMGAMQGLAAMRGYAGITRRQRVRLRLAIGFRIATYALGFPLGFAGLYFVLRPAHSYTSWGSPLGVWRSLIIVAGVAWLASYQIGLARNLRYRTMGWWERIAHHLVMLVLTPLTGLCETAGPFLGVLRWLVGARRATWTPTPKLSDRKAPDADSVAQATDQPAAA